MGTDAPQPGQDHGDVGSEHSPVGVGFVHDHVFEVAKKLCPAPVVGQNPHVQHVRVGDQYVGVFTGQARAGGSVSPS